MIFCVTNLLKGSAEPSWYTIAKTRPPIDLPSLDVPLGSRSLTLWCMLALVRDRLVVEAQDHVTRDNLAQGQRVAAMIRDCETEAAIELAVVDDGAGRRILEVLVDAVPPPVVAHGHGRQIAEHVLADRVV